MAIISLPAAAASATGSKSASAWSNTGWVEIEASTAAEYHLLHVVCNVFQTGNLPSVGAADTTSENVIEISTGSAGNETANIKVQMGSAHRADTLVNHVQWNAAQYWLPEPIVIPAGTRLSFRAHGGSAVAFNYTCRLTLEETSVAVTGTAAWTEDADTTAIVATHPREAALAWTEAADTMSASGSSVAGAAAWTEAADVNATAAAHGVSGTSAWTEANDTMSASGSSVSGAAAWTEANDTNATAAAHGVAGTASWTEANDTTAIVATHPRLAALAWTEAADTSSSDGGHGPAGTLAWTESNDTTAISGTHTPPINGPAAWTEANDTMAATGSSVSGAASWTDANDTTAIVAAHGANAALAWTETADTTSIDATHTAPRTAALVWVDDDDVMAATGEVIATSWEADLTWVEDDDGCTITAIHIRPKRARRGFAGIKPKRWNHRYVQLPDDRAALEALLPDVDVSEPEVVLVPWYPEDDELMMLC